MLWSLPQAWALCIFVKSDMANSKKKLLILAGCTFLIGCSLFLYSPIARWLEDRRQSEIYADYADDLADLDHDAMNEELNRAKRYNDNLNANISDPFDTNVDLNERDYNGLLWSTADGIMGYVEIPKIQVLLPIYHGVVNSILNKGVGHLPETSLPVGGKSTHAVLAGHSGMSHARLFTDLPTLKIGDVFYIHVYEKVLTYQVDQIKTVLPSNTADLTVIEGQDYVTLVTCTPRGVNSHRLLVRGHRTA